MTWKIHIFYEIKTSKPAVSYSMHNLLYARSNSQIYFQFDKTQVPRAAPLFNQFADINSLPAPFLL